MDVVGYLWHVGVTLAVGAAIARFEPTFVERQARRTGLDGRTGWAVAVVAALWLFLPVLAGAVEGELWFLGTGIGGVGCYLVVLAVGSVDEYRLLSRIDHVEPRRVTPGEPVATSGVPEGSDPEAAQTPLSGRPAVHTDWVVERRQAMGSRQSWRSLAGGVTATEFTIGDGAVEVRGGRHRVFTDAEHHPTYDPDEDLPERAADVLRGHPALPAPGERSATLRFGETYLPADEPVTVVGVPRQGAEPGRLVVDTAPPDDLLGTYADHATPEDTEPEAVLVRGRADEAERRLRKRVYGLGGAGLAMVLGGQWLAFRLSGATLDAFVALLP